jgi:transcription initiation factor TFIIIB Brf1 subunit/transcription initiation factor TFIIB
MDRETHIETTSKECNYSNKSGKSIMSELAKYKFNDDINIRANFIFTKMKLVTRRANKRTYLLFFCVYNAHKELGIKVNPSDLGKIFNLTQGQMQKTDSMFSPLQTGYKAVNRTISAVDYMPHFCDKLDLDQYSDDMVIFANNIITKHVELSQFVQQTVAAGILKYFLVINGIEVVDKKQISEVTFRSDTTIDSMYKKISELDNT